MSRYSDKGPAIVINPEEGASFWQPEPANGYVTVKLSPFNSPSNLFSTGIQVIDAGCSLREHAHRRNEELLFVYEGHGTAVVDGKPYRVSPGSLIYVGRWVKHGIVNESDSQMKVLWIIFPPGLETVLEAIGVPRTAGEPRPVEIKRPDNIREIMERGWFASPEELPPD